MSSLLDLEHLSGDLQAHIGLRTVAIGPDALDSLSGLVTGSVAVMTDAVTKSRAGVDLLEEINRRLPMDTTTLVLSGGRGRVHADEAALADATDRVRGASSLVTVGSGTLADIGKAVSAQLDGVQHVVVQTAASVNGFTDDQSVLLVKGVKRTTHTRWPDALVADATVLASAPVDMNLAGIGDLLAMFTAPADWRLAHMLGMADSYSAPVVDLVRQHGSRVLELAPRVAERDPDALCSLAEVLALSGISMGVAGTTAPASGMEHTVSHLIEMAMNSRGQDSPYHGAQVGVSTVVAAALWSRVREHMKAGRPRLGFPAEDEMEARVRDAFATLDPAGVMGEECWRLYAKKLRRWTANRQRLEDLDWSRVDSEVSRLLDTPERLAGSLASGGAPVRFRQLDPPVPEELVRWALANCHLMRDRFTAADLAFFLGAWDTSDVNAVLDRAAHAGGGL